jgi:hypothetical protein
MPKNKSKQKWSQKVTDNSDAMDLEGGVFKQRSAKKDRGLAQTFRRGKSAAEGNPVPVCNVDADLLHQSRWQAAVEVQVGYARQGQR